MNTRFSPLCSRLVLSFVFFAVIFLLFHSEDVIANEMTMVESSFVDVANFNDRESGKRVTKTDVDQKEKAIAIAQLNQCIESLSRIVESKNRAVLINEQHSLLNNLRTDLADNTVTAFRSKLNNDLSVLIINEEDKIRIQQYAEEEMDNAILQSVSSSLGQPWVATNVLSTVITCAKTAAQSVINYNIAVKKIRGSADKQTWEIDKESLKKIDMLRSEAITMSKEIFERYKLTESNKINYDEARLLSQALEKDDLDLRLNSLKNLFSQRSYNGSIGNYAPYWYFLGDTYIKLGKEDEGLDAYDKYLKMNENAPIFRKNVYEGLIYLDYISSRKKNVSNEEKREYLKKIEYNLADNGPAMIIVASTYYALGDVEKATRLLVSCLGDSNNSCKDEIVRTLANYYGKYSNNNELITLVNKALEESEGIRLTSLLDYIYAENGFKNPFVSDRLNTIKVTSKTHLKTIDNVSISLPLSISGSSDYMIAYVENRESSFKRRGDGNEYYLYRSLFVGDHWVERAKIEDEFDYFKEAPGDIEYIFNRIDKDWLVFRDGLDLSSVNTGAGLPGSIHNGFNNRQSSEKKGKQNEDYFNKLHKLWTEKSEKNNNGQRMYITSEMEREKELPENIKECSMLPDSPADYEISIVINENKTDAPTYVLKYYGEWGGGECTLNRVWRYKD